MCPTHFYGLSIPGHLCGAQASWGRTMLHTGSAKNHSGVISVINESSDAIAASLISATHTHTHSLYPKYSTWEAKGSLFFKSSRSKQGAKGSSPSRGPTALSPADGSRLDNISCTLKY